MGAVSPDYPYLGLEKSDFIKEKKFNPVVIIVIENMEDVEELEKHKGYIKSKDNVILKYTLKRK